RGATRRAARGGVSRISVSARATFAAGLANMPLMDEVVTHPRFGSLGRKDESAGVGAATSGPPKQAPRDADRTRAKILSAASTEFAHKGLAGARVDAIAEASGANKRMIYYYFGSK